MSSRLIACVTGICFCVSATLLRAQQEDQTKTVTEQKARMEPLEQFSKYIAPYEPIYFLMGPETPAVKFQFSFKCMPILGLSDYWIQPVFAYTQTSFWDIFAPSAPFYDTSYKPTAFAYLPNVFRTPATNFWHLDLQSGYQHESNGKGGTDSRSMNMVYLQGVLRLGDPEKIHFNVTGRTWFYIMDLSDNPDIAQYRGYANVGVKAGYERYEVSAKLQIGDTGEHAGVLLDFTAPLLRRYHFMPYLHIQYFNGYGETLLGYNKRTESVRFGLSLYQ